MKKLYSIISIVLFTMLFNYSFGQVTIWTEDFQAATGNDAYSGANGNWIMSATGINATEAGRWRVDNTEAGNAPGNCGSAGGTDQSLFMGTSNTFYGLGITGAAMLADPSAETNKRFESPIIDCSSYTSITIEFDYIESRAGAGADPDDNATLWYFDGVSWAQIDPIALTPNTCNPQGTWTNFTAFALPASADNNANIKIGFNWVADADLNGIDPSFAVDDIIIKGIASGAPTVTALYTQNTTSPICVGTTVTFTDASSAVGTTINSWSWDFNGGATNVTGQGPQAITFNTAGTFNVDLTVTDGTISDTYTTSITVNVAANAGADNTENVCNTGGTTTLDLNTLLSGADAGGTWTETSGTASGQFTAGTGVFDGNGLTTNNVYTFDYTVTGTAPCPDDVSTFTITIIDCSVAIVIADYNQDIPSAVCAGTTITFTDASTANATTITGWDWTFNGGDVTSANTQGPHSITFNSAGTFSVDLTVTDGTVSDTYSTSITVNALPNVTGTASPGTSICTGDQATLTGGGATSYTWSNGVTDGVAFTPTVGSTTYTVTGTDANSCTNTATVTLVVAECVPMVAGFSFADNICVGSCIDFTDTTSGNPVSWSWDFSSDGTPLSSTDQNPTNICFNTAGVFSIQLTVTDAGGTSVSTTNSITVFDVPTVTAVLDTLIDLGGEAELIATSPNIGTYLWTPNTYYIDCDTCASTYAQPQLNTDYIVIFTDPNGCTAEDTVYVTVNFIEGIGVPQAFSPNGDGNNDQLVVKGFGIDQMNFKIYNRYGQLVFESQDQEHGWDGNFKGKEENPGVFVWVLEYRLLNNSSGILKGNTTLIR